MSVKYTRCDDGMRLLSESEGPRLLLIFSLLCELTEAPRAGGRAAIHADQPSFLPLQILGFRTRGELPAESRGEVWF